MTNKPHTHSLLGRRLDMPRQFSMTNKTAYPLSGVVPADVV